MFQDPLFFALHLHDYTQIHCEGCPVQLKAPVLGWIVPPRDGV